MYCHVEFEGQADFNKGRFSSENDDDLVFVKGIATPIQIPRIMSSLSTQLIYCMRFLPAFLSPNQYRTIMYSIPTDGSLSLMQPNFT